VPEYAVPNCDDDCSDHDDQYQHHTDDPVAELQRFDVLLAMGGGD
jgi:hypothetical protein